ncbi:hypothetical protein NBRC10512_003108 [Rhodotorula toruloides]|uniref:RHTO0S05e10154g1_1 n=2 Tax=Rhodotorula toruloides TaxID=5286 RepID=A0A061B1X9_RHOTO|nr:glycoside hydrolase family 16 protein [Rhodotorula toruloides NP11]EMS23702.1 glycoside hydrolase family 16 protein [Rhodotorula toruloides NP11]CDR40976.1 RHTO0S05e10154g1_1 [Rhodotorula toruloides]
MRWRTSSAFLALSLSAVAPAVQAAYSLQTAYQGDSFFDGWDFWGNRDNLTNGAVNYVSRSTSSQVAYTNSAGNVVIKVDNSTKLASGVNALRDSVRITTNAAFDVGSLFVMDALHVPYGCSVWPAFWAHARSWPSGGELDIFEGVNLQQTNQVAMHTVAGCYAANSTVNVTATGDMTFNNCDYTVAANHGCTFQDARNASYGADFAAAGGGIYAAEFSSDAISVWFFPRAEIPADLRSVNGPPDPSSWGIPMAYYPSSACNINQYFAPQQITINIALCGDWAGQPGVFSPTCGTGNCADYILDPSHFDTAYFEIASVRIYAGGVNTRSSGGAQAASGVIGAIGGSASATSSAVGGRWRASGAALGAVGIAAAVSVLAGVGLFVGL